MNARESGELRRRLTVDKSSVTKIYCCYVNTKKEIIGVSDVSLGTIPADEAERYLNLLKKVLSGSYGRNLLDIPFTNAQVAEGEEHKLLTLLRDSGATDTDARMTLFEKIAESVSFEEKNALILLAYDVYDVPVRKYDAAGAFDEESDNMFKYIICAVCPVVPEKTELGYIEKDKAFHNTTSPRIAASPELGFLFPAFDSRRANIYNAQMYTKSAADVHEAFIEAVFHAEKPPMSALEQKENFNGALAEALDDACSLNVVQTVHEQLRERIEQHKESRDPEPLDLSASDIGDILSASGVDEAKVETFKEKCGESFGAFASLDPHNIIDTGRFDMVTPQVKISVSPDYAYAVETRVIDGRKFILIPADDGVEVNGLNVNIREE